MVYAFMGNYYKHGLSVIIPFIILLAGAHGLDRREAISLPVMGVTVLILLTALYFPYFIDKPGIGGGLINTALRGVVTLFLIAHALLIALLKNKKAAIYAKTALVVLLCMEAGVLSYSTVNNRKALSTEQFKRGVGYNDATTEAIAYLQSKDSGFYRINKDYSSSIADVKSINDAKVQGFFGTPAYSSFNKQEYIEFLKTMEIIPRGQEAKTRWAIGLLKRPLLQALAGAKYVLFSSNEPNNLRRLLKPEAMDRLYEPVAEFETIEIMKNRFFLPLGITYDSFMTQPAFERLPSKTAKDLMLFQAVIADSPLPGIEQMNTQQAIDQLEGFSWPQLAAAVRSKRGSSLRIQHFSQNQITGEISLDSRKLLFFSIPYDKGWRAEVDGREKPLLKANIGFMGILLDKGTHEISLTYHLSFIYPGLSVSVISLLVYAGMLRRRHFPFAKTRRAGGN
jgi:uncharacterized membrane protein YfhO